ncbi:4-phosphoerythronate dehydrogenase [Marinomonas balearica]|uniref:Erythronate-4-phosphate dehydrogenase n=1 Tax=Marinomonas balearica TaxID=491947 RepID=A0A4R6M5Z6_9GAMM|nr:4-phosphoerythronate dehydrogenase [Marinomonas balearica]TDO96743.1 4-phosphoerythronate dehydrogenase [Marinomonas balearica]
MKIIADENMPNVLNLFSSIGDVSLMPGRSLSNEEVKNADILLVRSVTKVTPALLKDSNIKFVGSATIGTDHIDLEHLQNNNICFSSAPGCNADAVADYVFSALSHLYLNKKLTWLNKRIGIIGHGNVGKTVYQRFETLGCNVIAYDPFVQNNSTKLTTLDDVMDCDIICLHAPLTKTGSHPTYNMLGKEQLKKLKPDTTIISAGRGGVICEDSLIARLEELEGRLNLVWDVWKNEPHINTTLLDKVDLATPHIAGYSKQGREKGTWMVYLSLCKFLNIKPNLDYSKAVSRGSITNMLLNEDACLHDVLARAILAVYDISRDDTRLRRKYRNAPSYETFDWLRKHYVERDEFNTCIATQASYQRELNAIGFKRN